MGVGDFLFVDPRVGVEFVGLEDVIEMGVGIAKDAVGQFVGGLEDAVLFEVGDGAGVEHENAEALPCEDAGRHAAGVAGANDEDVVDLFGHGGLPGGIDREPVGRGAAGAATAAVVIGGGLGHFLGVLGGGADISADVGEEALVGVRGRVERPGDEEGAEDLVGLFGGDFTEGFFEEAAGLGIEMIEAGAVEGLAGLGRGAIGESRNSAAPASSAPGRSVLAGWSRPLRDFRVANWVAVK